MLAIDVQQVANINLLNPWADIQLIADINGKAFFSAQEPQATQRDLWVTDGTAAGTTRLATGGSAVAFANVNGTFFFNGYDSDHGYELWKSDGTPEGTALVRDLAPGAESSSIRNLVNLDGRLLFTSDGRLFRTDGTEQGTFRLSAAGATLWNVDAITPTGSTSAVFSGRTAQTGSAALFKTDGASTGTTFVENLTALGEPENVNGTVFFVQNDEVWKYSGTGVSELVKDVEEPRELTNVNGTLFFAADTAEIWKSDGTSGGTVLLGNSADRAFGLANANGRLYFTGGLVANGDGFELWTNSGASIMQVRDLNPSFHYAPDPGYGGYGYNDTRYGDGSYPGHYTNVNGTVYFLTRDSGSLWTTDGTEAGTVRVDGGGFESLLNFQGTPLLSGKVPGSEGVFLYTSDGSPDSAEMIPRFGPSGKGSSNPGPPINVNGTLFFAADDGVHGQELWKLDNGTASLVKDIVPGAQSSLGGNEFKAFVNFQGTLYFRANGLWKTDGTPDGTVPVLDSLGNPVQSPDNLTIVGDQLFFSAFDDQGGRELWKSDGTAAGTMRVKDINPGDGPTGHPLYSDPSHLVNFNGKLFFAAYDSIHGGELWQSDGTEAGTSLVKDLFLGQAASSPNSSIPRNLTNLNGVLYFSAADAAGRGLWKSDGTADGTTLIMGPAQGLTLDFTDHFGILGNTLYFPGADGDGEELWKTDGTALGTVQVKDLISGPQGSWIFELTTVGDVLYFSASQQGSVSGVLWRSDGTEAGTQPIANAGSDVANLANVVGTLFYAADVRFKGRELFHVTNSGTVEINDVLPGADGSKPGSFAVIGDKLYFAANGSLGRELWAAVSPAGPPNDAPVLDASLNPALAAIPEDVKTPKSTLVSSLLVGAVTDVDVDADALRGIAVTTASSFHGTWQFSTNGGTTWQAMDVPEAGARLLPGWARVRFIPEPDFNGTVKLFYHAWDQTSGSVGGTINIAGNVGGTGSLSTAYEGASLTVTPVNDPPKLMLGGTLGYVHDRAPITLAAGALVSDVDNADFRGGRLRVRITDGASATNRLVIGTGYTVDGLGNVLHGTTVIGKRVSNGFGTNDLVIYFKSSATEAIVQQLVRAITFKTVGGAAGQRKVVFTVNDGNGGVSAGAFKTVNVT